jgi:hypothetical protein
MEARYGLAFEHPDVETSLSEFVRRGQAAHTTAENRYCLPHITCSQ